MLISFQMLSCKSIIKNSVLNHASSRRSYHFLTITWMLATKKEAGLATRTGTWAKVRDIDLEPANCRLQLCTSPPSSLCRLPVSHWCISRFETWCLHDQIWRSFLNLQGFSDARLFTDFLRPNLQSPSLAEKLKFYDQCRISVWQRAQAGKREQRINKVNHLHIPSSSFLRRLPTAITEKSVAETSDAIHYHEMNEVDFLYRCTQFLRSFN